MGGSSTTTQTNKIPDWQNQSWMNLIGKSDAQTNQDINSVDQGKIQGQFAGATQNILNQGPAGIISAGKASQNWTQPGVAQSWMSPYTNTALASQLNLDRSNLLNPELESIDQGAAASGALGGDRSQVLKGMALNQFNQNEQNVVNQGENQAYNTGLGAFQRANAQNLTGQEAGAQEGIYSNFAAGQNNLNAIAASEAPGQQLASEAGILSALPDQSTRTNVQQQSPGSMFGSILGGLTGAAGIGLKAAGFAEGGGIVPGKFTKPRKPRHRKMRKAA